MAIFFYGYAAGVVSVIAPIVGYLVSKMDFG